MGVTSCVRTYPQRILRNLAYSHVDDVFFQLWMFACILALVRMDVIVFIFYIAFTEPSTPSVKNEGIKFAMRGKKSTAVD